MPSMSRTITTVINDIIRQFGGSQDYRFCWELPVTRNDGWECMVDISLYRYRMDEDSKVHISVYAYGYRKEDEPRHGGMAHYHGLSGSVVPRRLTRKWIDTVLVEAIETARLACLAFTDADLRPPFSRLDTLDVEEYRQEKAYFESTLNL